MHLSSRGRYPIVAKGAALLTGRKSGNQFTSSLFRELRNRISEAFDRPLSATLLFDYPTLAALAAVLLPASAPVAAARRDDVLDEVADLTDEEAELLLARELGQSEAGR